MYVVTSGILDGKPDYLQAVVAAVVTYWFSTQVMGLKKKSALGWSGLAALLEYL